MKKRGDLSAFSGLLLYEVAVFLVIILLRSGETAERFLKSLLLKALDQTALALLHEVLYLDHLSSPRLQGSLLTPLLKRQLKALLKYT